MAFVNILSTLGYVLLAIAILLLMVLIHEFGHYVAGRALGFKIEEFSVGFGKAIISKKNKRGETISLRLFPLGGYCAFAGEDDENGTNKDSFVAQAPWKRIIVFLAGVTFNFLTAIITSIAFLTIVGYDVKSIVDYTPLSQVESYTSGEKKYYYSFKEEDIPEYYREKYVNGEILLPGDVVFAVNGIKIDFAYSKTFEDRINGEFDKLSAWMKSSTEQEPHTISNYDYNPDDDIAGDGSLIFNVRRGGEYIDVHVPLIYTNLYTNEECTEYALNTEGKPIHLMSIGFRADRYRHTFWEALARCIPFSIGLAWFVLKTLWQLITFQLGINMIGGTVTTIATIVGTAQQSFVTIFAFIPMIAANLAVFNALPFPALDGSHVVFTLIEWIRGKPINRKIENIIHACGLAILFGFVIIVDILHFVL